MASIDVSGTAVRECYRLVQDAENTMLTASQRMLRRLRESGSTWNDQHYREFEAIVMDCANQLGKARNDLKAAKEYLRKILSVVDEMDRVFQESYGYASMSSSNSGNVRGGDDKDAAIAEGLAHIDQAMDALAAELNANGTDPEQAAVTLRNERDQMERRLYDSVYGDVSKQCAQCLRQLATFFTMEHWQCMDRSQRKDALTTLAVNAGHAFRTEVLGVKFFHGSSSSRGYYDGDGYLYLNADVLSDPANRLDALDTIFHEGRHAFQHAAAANPNRCSVEREQAAIWEWNLQPEHYIRYERNPRRYFAQPVEADARAFAEGVLTDSGFGQ